MTAPHFAPDSPVPRIPDLLDPAVRARLAGALPAVIRMLEAWELTRAQQGSLLTLSARTVQRAAHGQTLPRLTPDQLTRMSLITGIYAALHTLYRDGSADGWMTRVNRRPPFAGRAPLSVVLAGGIPMLLAVRRLLEADLGGMFSASEEARRQARTLPQPPIELPEPAQTEGNQAP